MMKIHRDRSTKRIPRKEGEVIKLPPARPSGMPPPNPAHTCRPPLDISIWTCPSEGCFRWWGPARYDGSRELIHRGPYSPTSAKPPFPSVQSPFGLVHLTTVAPPPGIEPGS